MDNEDYQLLIRTFGQDEVNRYEEAIIHGLGLAVDMIVDRDPEMRQISSNEKSGLKIKTLSILRENYMYNLHADLYDVAKANGVRVEDLAGQVPLTIPTVEDIQKQVRRDVEARRK